MCSHCATTTNHIDMTRETPQFGLRMPADLREAIEKEASINGRSINAEIVSRLRNSLNNGVPATMSYAAKEPQNEQQRGSEISDIERHLLTIFRRMPVEKQLALVSLFK